MPRGFKKRGTKHPAGLAVLCICTALCLALTGCQVFFQWDDPVPYVSPRPTAEPTEHPSGTPEATDFPTAEPTQEPTQEPNQEPTPEPSSEPTPGLADLPTETPGVMTASLGFAGDVLLMQAQIAAANTGSGYDFKDMFRPMQALFESVDFMVLNFEGTLAGAAAGYTQPKPTEIPATEDNPNPPKLFQRFNAPDEIVDDLMALGVDGFSTANNHCLDKGVEGLLRTIKVMDEKGAFHTGTFASMERFNTADIVDINGIKVGFVSATHSVNSYDAVLTQEQSRYMVTRLYNDSMTSGAIARCREQGAELVVVMAHWGRQYQQELNYDQQEYTQKLIGWGADAIIGCHPHVIQTIKWVTGSREGRAVTVPVAYSMGNFISNMSRANYPVDIGMFVRLDVKKTSMGAEVTGISCVPTYDYIHTVGGRYINEVIPCFDDMSGVPSLAGLGQAQAGIQRARQHCKSLAGADVPMIKNPLIG